MAKKTVNHSGKVTPLRGDPEGALGLLQKLTADVADVLGSLGDFTEEEARRVQGLLFAINELLTNAVAGRDPHASTLQARAMLGILEDQLGGGGPEWEAIYEQITKVAARLGEPSAIAYLTTQAAPASDTQASGESTEPVEVEGWANSNWLTKCSPVVLRPEASALDLLSWGIGQVEQAETIMLIMGSSHCDLDIEPGEATGPARMLTQQGLIALRAAADKLFQASHSK